MSMHDPSKFVLSETCSNRDGKSSGSGFAGLLLIVVGAICFLSTMVGYFLKLPDTLAVMQNIIFLIAAGSALLGVRKVFGDKGIAKPKTYDNSSEDNNVNKDENIDRKNPKCEEGIPDSKE